MAAASVNGMEANFDENLPVIYARLRQYLEDDTFSQYERHLQALGPGSGRSRPCKLQPIAVLTNRFLLQLGLLRLKKSATWTALSQFARKLLTTTLHLSLDSLVLSVENRAAQLDHRNADLVLHFLEGQRDLIYPKNSPYCVKFDVTLAFLLMEENAVAPQAPDLLPNGLVIELEKCKREKKLSGIDMFRWISVLRPGHGVESKPLIKHIRDLMKKHERAAKDKRRKPAEYESFLEAVFHPHSASTPAPPMTAESPPVTAESTPVTAESTPVTAESTPVTAESTPVTAESTPVTAESTPVTAESTPVTAESTPVTAESTPVTAESTPVTAESTPVTAESTPVTAESTPVTAESTPVTAESAPMTAESTPMTAESTPVTAESTTVTAESTTVTAESTPVTAEYTPVTAEYTPVTAESTPVTAESTPVSAESICTSSPPMTAEYTSTCESYASVVTTDKVSRCRNCDTMHSQLENMASHMLHLKLKVEAHPSTRHSHLEPVVVGLREVLKKKNEQISTLTVESEECRQQLKKTTCELDTAKSALYKVQKESAVLKKNAQNLKRAAEYAKQKKDALCNDVKQKEANMDQLQHQHLLEIQTIKEREEELKKQLNAELENVLMLTRSLKAATEERENMELQLQEQTAPVVNTKEDGRYSDAIQICAAQLVGELEVAAARVPSIIQSVAKHVFNTEVNLKDLPKKTSVIRYVDNAHAVAKMHLNEEMLSSRFDLHTDGTSRDRKYFIGQQITLENKKSLSCGFHRVSTESAQTLTDVTMNLITEIASIATEGENDNDTEAMVKTMLSNLNATMSDRASVMKAFNREFEQARKDILGTEEGLDFLYCQAHFLLGLSTAAEKALSEVEKKRELKSNLGRDKMPAFGHFRNSASEPAALRALRTTCDILGPRGDEKSGCRNSWLGFCSLQCICSQITSFRGNRFNNTFEGAAGIIHHLEDITSFLTRYSDESPNLKIQSVLADLTDDTIITMLAALAMVYICVSGPFWVMINSDVHYLDLYQHIQKMQASLTSVVDNPDLFYTYQTRLDSALDSFFLENTPVVQSVSTFVRENIPDQEIFRHAVTEMCSEFLKTTTNQLKDFIAGGKYSSPPSPEDRQRMAHCRTTNLLGEACFGDMDYSMNKRRHSSTFHHTTVNMMKRNQPLSTWLSHKPAMEQKRLLSLARAKGTALRKGHQKKESLVVEEDKQRIVARRRALEEKQRKAEEKKFCILQDIASCPLQRACTTERDVDDLLEACPTLTAKKEALKLQFRYHRVVMNFKSRLLQVGKKDMVQQVADFKSFLGQFSSMRPSLDFDECSSADDLDPPPPKRVRMAVPASDPDTDSDTPCQTESDVESDTEDECLFHGTFNCQGQSVAVHYDEQLFVGEVLEVHSPSSATVTFMAQESDRNSFFWPASLDIDRVETKFVVQWDLSIQPVGARARKWSLENFSELQRRHRVFQSLFC